MTVFDFTARSIDGRDLPLSTYRGSVLLVVNVASRCGFTPQYAGLQALYEQHRERGFVVLGFPSNQFGAQEPGPEEEIRSFCTRRFGVTFPLFAKIDVKGAAAHPLYHFLTAARPGLFGTRGVKWNFTKFLVDREGRPVKRYGPRRRPESIAPDIEALLER